MSGKYLLDTNIIIALFAEDPFVQKHIAKAGEIFIPATVIEPKQRAHSPLLAAGNLQSEQENIKSVLRKIFNL